MTPCQVFVYTPVSVCIVYRHAIVCDFSSFLVLKRVQDFGLHEMSPFSQLRLGLFIAPKCVKSQNQLPFHIIKCHNFPKKN